MNPSAVIAIVCECTGIKIEEVRIKTRIREIAFARHLCMYFMKKLFNSTYARIGLALKPNDPYNHSTTINGIKHIQDMIDSKDEETLEMIHKIEIAIDEFSKRDKESLRSSVSDIVSLLNRIPYYPIQPCQTFGELAEQLNKRLSA